MSLIFKQFKCPETSTFTYLFGDGDSKEVALVDSVREQADLYIAYLNNNGLKLRWLIETHVHADHVTANALLKKEWPQAQIALSAHSEVKCECSRLKDGDAHMVGAVPFQVFHTPGHTQDSLCLLVAGHRLLTGDTLFIGSCGRTDFQNGSSTDMFNSLRRLATLPGETLVYPGHDYNNRFVSCLSEEMIHNKLLNHPSLEAFREDVDNWNLPPPRKLKESVPANLMCGDI